MFEQGLDDLDEANEYTDVRLKLFEKLDKKAQEQTFNKNTPNVYFSLEVMVDVAKYEEDDPELAFRMRDKKTHQVKYLWSHEKFLERLELM